MHVAHTGWQVESPCCYARYSTVCLERICEFDSTLRPYGSYYPKGNESMFGVSFEPGDNPGVVQNIFKQIGRTSVAL